MQVATLLYDPGAGRLESGDEALIDAWRAHDEAILWVDIEAHDRAAESRLMTETFALHPLAVQDALRDRHPPKIETFDTSLFVLLRGLDADTTDIDFGVLQLSMFVGERFILTRHDKRSVSIGLVRQAVHDRPELLAGGPGAVAVDVANALVRRYLEILLALEPRLDALEEEIFERPDDEQLAELTQYKSRLRQLTRIANYHLLVAQKLQDERNAGFIPARLQHDVTDVVDQLERTSSLGRLYYETASDLTDAYLAFASHRLNRVMQVLTVFTVIFVPLTFLAGIYGMNFEHMPELSRPHAYFVLLGVMALIGFWQFWYFKKRHWV